MERVIHQGRNVKRFREMLGIKQESLASELGDDWNQRKVSVLEAKETIDNEILDKIANVLKVPKEAIQSFDEEKAFYNIQHNYAGSNATASHFNTSNNYGAINLAEHWLEALAEIRNLYERLLTSEKEKLELLRSKDKRD